MQGVNINGIKGQLNGPKSKLTAHERDYFNEYVAKLDNASVTEANNLMDELIEIVYHIDYGE